MDYKRDLATLAAETARVRSSNRTVKRGLFAPASPALSSDISSSGGTRKPSLRPPETGALFIYLLSYYHFLTFILMQFPYMMVERVN